MKKRQKREERWVEEYPSPRVIVRDCSLGGNVEASLTKCARAFARRRISILRSLTHFTPRRHIALNTPQSLQKLGHALRVCVCACIIFCVCAFRMGGPTRSTKRGLIIIRRRKHVYEWRQLFGRQHCAFRVRVSSLHGTFSLGTTERARFFRRLFW